MSKQRLRTEVMALCNEYAAEHDLEDGDMVHVLAGVAQTLREGHGVEIRNANTPDPEADAKPFWFNQ